MKNDWFFFLFAMIIYPYIYIGGFLDLGQCWIPNGMTTPHHLTDDNGFLIG